MKKVLVPFEGDRYPQDLLDFAAILDPITPLSLTAAFVPETDYASLVGASGLAESIGLPGAKEAAMTVNEHSRLLTGFCNERGIDLNVHMNERDFALPCLLKESRYADLLLLSAVHFFEAQQKDQPNAWMKEMLHRSECPVLLLPEKAALPGELILAYDGSAESVYALREFACLFPELTEVVATLVYVNEDPWAAIPNEAAIRELCDLHYQKFGALALRMPTADFFHTWMGKLNNPWIIMGSFGRSGLSEMLSRSFSTEVIRAHRVPVFMAHQ